MNQSLILDLLENNARLTSQDLADILNEDEASIKSEIQSLEKNKNLDSINICNLCRIGFKDFTSVFNFDHISDFRFW